MGSSFKSRYTVETVPWYWWLPMHCYGWIAGFAMFLYFALVATTSRVSYRGHPLDPDQNYIFCFWHQYLLAYLSLSVRHSNLSHMIHPAWYMVPSHRASRLKGARKLVLGSSGNRGRDAAAKLVEYLKQGDNTFFTPDGPYGPNRKLHSGAIHVAIASGVPLVGLTISVTPCITLSGWDSKYLPLPFSRFTVNYGAPFHASEDDLDGAKTELERNMAVGSSTAADTRE